MFLESCGEVIRVLCGNEEGNWVISYDNPCTPKFVLRDDLRTMERIEPPKDFQMRMTQEQTPGQKKRQELISDLLEEEFYVWDRTGTVFPGVGRKSLSGRKKKGGERRDEGRKRLPMGNRHVLLYSEEVFPAECV